MARNYGGRLGVAAALMMGMALSAFGEYALDWDGDGMVTVNGERTLILGLYHTPKSEEPFQEMAETGFNVARVGAGQMDAAHEAGLMTWAHVGTLNLDDLDATREQLIERVEAVKDHPSLALIEQQDEPAWTWMSAERRTPAEAMIEAYPIIKDLAPNTLVYTNHAPTNLVSTLQAYNDATDIVACDIYPVNPGGIKFRYALFPDGHQGDLLNEHISQVGDYTQKMHEVAEPGQPVFMVLQAFAWEMLIDEEYRRDEKILFPTRDQSRFMAFQALINGATGLMYWGNNYMPQPSQAWSDVKDTVREVADLAGPLTEPTAPIDIETIHHEMGHSVDMGIQIMAKEHGGALYVFTCNGDKNIAKATLSGFDDWTHCEVVNEDRALDVEDGAITDTWKRFDVHIYRFTR